MQSRRMPRPITFGILNHKNIYRVRYEIEGGGKAIERQFVRKNEEEFFNFLAEFK